MHLPINTRSVREKDYRLVKVLRLAQGKHKFTSKLRIAYTPKQQISVMQKSSEGPTLSLALVVCFHGEGATAHSNPTSSLS